FGDDSMQDLYDIHAPKKGD
ncbi:hypothetical protein MGSAQ_002753, partial [marine sediment metagenome]